MKLLWLKPWFVNFFDSYNSARFLSTYLYLKSHISVIFKDKYKISNCVDSLNVCNKLTKKISWKFYCLLGGRQLERWRQFDQTTLYIISIFQFHSFDRKYSLIIFRYLIFSWYLDYMWLQLVFIKLILSFSCSMSTMIF